MTSHKPSTSFNDAAKYLSTSTSLSGVSNDIKLELYGLFKFITTSTGPTTSRPSLFEFTGRAKWDSWKRTGEFWRGNVSGAEDRYTEIAGTLGWTLGQTHEYDAPPKAAEKTVEELLAEEDASHSSHDQSSNISGDGGMGIAVSTMMMQEEQGGVGGDAKTLHTIAISGNAQALVNALSKDLNLSVNSIDEYGFTPLHLACDRGHIAVVQSLLEYGADKSIQDPDGFTALELAREIGHEDIVSLLESHSQKSPMSS